LRISRVIIIIAAVVIIGLLAIFVYASFEAPTSSGPWASGPGYPLEASDTSGVVGQSCVNSTGTIYCIGGIDYNGASRNNVYSAAVSSTGMSSWTADSNYPQTVGLESCVSYNDYAYCVGGSYDDAGDDIASSYFAPLTATGPGPWDQTTAYPAPVDSQACVSSSGYIYCLGGENETTGLNASAVSTNSAWYAPLSSSGIGAWDHTTAYSQSVAFEACAATMAEIYCVGGVGTSDSGVSNVYYAPLSASGIGQWSSTTSYPMDAYGQTCVIASGNIICVGGVPNGTTSSSDTVYSAPVSSSGVGAWYHASNYPMGVETACAASSGNLYCVGGYQDSSQISSSTYYATVQSLLPSTASG
jgi:hypothetical protein